MGKLIKSQNTDHFQSAFKTTSIQSQQQQHAHHHHLFKSNSLALNQNLNKMYSKSLTSSSSFKIDDILNNPPCQSEELQRNLLKSNKKCAIDPEPYMATLNHNTNFMNHKFMNENLALPLLAYNSSASSSSPSSSSSFCSPNITNPAYNGFNLMSNEFYLNQQNFALLNPFVSSNQTPNYQQLLENNLSIFDQFALFEKQKLDCLKLTTETYPSTNSTNNPNNENKSSSSSSSNDISNKLNIINQLAKQIDSLNEATSKEGKKEKKKDKLSKKKSKESNDECCSASCSDLACFQKQVPMCLRGATEEQLQLASLFNTLIHHKKCRRTRTVFSDMQLIGLEKRFENQKYLSTPDRIQLAESLGLSQLQVKTWYQNRRMKWKKKVLKEGSNKAPTKPKGRPKKNSIPSFSEIMSAANNKSTGSSSESITSGMKNDSFDTQSHSSDDDDEEMSDENDNEYFSDTENDDEEEEEDDDEEELASSDQATYLNDAISKLHQHFQNASAVSGLAPNSSKIF